MIMVWRACAFALLILSLGGTAAADESTTLISLRPEQITIKPGRKEPVDRPRYYYDLYQADIPETLPVEPVSEDDRYRAALFQLYRSSGQNIQAVADARTTLVTLAEAGHAAAQVWYGVQWEFGRLPQGRDTRKAVGWYQRAADQEYADGLLLLGMHRHTAVSDGEVSESIRLWRRAAVAGDRPSSATAAYAVGWSYFHGENAPRNHERALHWWLRGLELGHVPSRYAVAYMTEFGLASKASLRAALPLYQQAAEEGDGRAAVRLAQIYERGTPSRGRAEQAFRYWIQAMGSGRPEARFRIARYFETDTLPVTEIDGEPIPGIALAQVIETYQALARDGFAPALYLLGTFCEQGRYTAKDPELAGQWYELALAFGSEQAVLKLGKPLPPAFR